MIEKEDSTAIDLHPHAKTTSGISETMTEIIPGNSSRALKIPLLKTPSLKVPFKSALKAPFREPTAISREPEGIFGMETAQTARTNVFRFNPSTRGGKEFIGAFMVTLPNLRHLLAALEVSRAGSVSKAAKRIHLSQSAVTQAVSGLEKYLGISLFNRTATGMLTTAAGHVFLKRVARGYQWLEAIEQLTAHQSPSKQRVARLLTLSQIRALITVVETESYTRAAAQLKVTQPTVHRAIKELEALFHQALFQRSPQGVVPNWHARQLARYASLFIAEIARGMEEVSEFQGQMTGSICIGALPLSRTRMVPRAVTQLLADFPEAKIRIVDGPYEEQLRALLHGQLDIIVGALRHPLPSPDIVQERLFVDQLNIVIRPGHWLAEKKTLSPNELPRVNWIAPRESTPAREAFTLFFQREGIDPPARVVECSSLTVIRGLLLESDMAALLPARQVEVDIRSGLLAVSPVSLTGTTREIGITVRRDWQPTKIQQRFLHLLKADT